MDSKTLHEIPRIYVGEAKVSEITNVALATLRNNRSQGKGIPYVKNSRSIRYFLPDVYQYMESRKIQTQAV